MTDEAKSPLRRRMIEDMTIRKLAPKTQSRHCIVCSLPPAIPRLRAKIRLLVWSTICTAKRAMRGFFGSPARGGSRPS